MEPARDQKANDCLRRATSRDGIRNLVELELFIIILSNVFYLGYASCSQIKYPCWTQITWAVPANGNYAIRAWAATVRADRETVHPQLINSLHLHVWRGWPDGKTSPISRQFTVRTHVWADSQPLPAMLTRLPFFIGAPLLDWQWQSYVLLDEDAEATKALREAATERRSVNLVPATIMTRCRASASAN